MADKPIPSHRSQVRPPRPCKTTILGDETAAKEDEKKKTPAASGNSAKGKDK